MQNIAFDVLIKCSSNGLVRGIALIQFLNGKPTIILDFHLSFDGESRIIVSRQHEDSARIPIRALFFILNRCLYQNSLQIFVVVEYQIPRNFSF